MYNNDNFSEKGVPTVTEKSRVVFKNSASESRYNPCGICQNNEEPTQLYTFTKCVHCIYVCANPQCKQEIENCPAGCSSTQKRQIYLIERI